MKHLLLIFCSIFFFAIANGQNSLGMTVGTYRGWGDGILFKDYAKKYSGDVRLDSASNEDMYQIGDQLKSGITVGFNYRFLSADTSVWKGKWSRNISLFLGTAGFNDGASYERKLFDINTPYTSIFHGDTTTFILDSTSESSHTLKSQYAFIGQLGFAVNRVFLTHSRIQAEVGAGIRIGIGSIENIHVNNRTFSYVEDSSLTYSYLPQKTTSHQYALPMQTYFSGQFELNVGGIFPLAKDEENWWISAHASVGVGGIYALDKFYTRITFIPSFGLNYRFTQQK